MADIVLDQAGYIIKLDPHDLGVRMKPAVPGVVYDHPEDAHSPSPTRGDYIGRVQPRLHYRRGRRNLWGEFEPAPRGGS